MKKIESAQILDLEVPGDKTPKLGRGEKMAVECDAATVAELDLAPVAAVILLEVPRLFERIHEDRRHASGRADRADEMTRGDATQFGQDGGQAPHREMVEDAIEAKAEVDGGIGLRQPAEQIPDLEG